MARFSPSTPPLLPDHRAPRRPTRAVARDRIRFAILRALGRGIASPGASPTLSGPLAATPAQSVGLSSSKQFDPPQHRLPSSSGARWVLPVALCTVGAMTGVPNNPARAEDTFPAVFELSSLAAGDGTNGFVLNGIDADDRSGLPVAGAGDVNGDGVDDVIIGAYRADPNGKGYAGESYVVFGTRDGVPASLDLSALDGTNGFVLNGLDPGDFSGISVAGAGDVNGDGVDDLIIGAPNADPNGNSSGESYVVFGRSDGFPASLDLSALDGDNGFVLNGIDSGDGSGGWVAGAGDVNGDGVDDVIIGAYRADPNGKGYAGESYVVFGTRDGVPATLELSALDGTNGFVLNGIDALDRSGRSVAGAGDVSGDGVDDVISGADFAGPNGNSWAGESYVVFGTRDGVPATLELSALDGTNGFVLNGIDESDFSGRSVSGAEDVNGDGVDDLIIGAEGADPNGDSSGESYVVFGTRDGFPASLELSALDGTNGFVLNGIDPGDDSGPSVAGAGDVNGDGVDDLIIGANGADPNGKGYAGESYVVFGTRDGFPASLELSALDGTNGFVLSGIDAFDGSGGSVAGAGDVNGDGVDDLIIGADGADPNGNDSGESYVVFGRAENRSPIAVDDEFITDTRSTVDGNLISGTDAGQGQDTDPDEDTLSIFDVNGATALVDTTFELTSGALVSIARDGSFTYDPNGAFRDLRRDETATDTFTYRVTDGTATSNEATVTVTIGASGLWLAVLGGLLLGYRRVMALLGVTGSRPRSS